MAKNFSSLNKTQAKDLHKSIKERYENIPPEQIEKIYISIKSRYDELKRFVDLQRQLDEQKKQMEIEAKRAQEQARYERRVAINAMGIIETMSNLFSSKRYYSLAHKNAEENAEILFRRVRDFKNKIYSNEVLERKKIYHELKVLGEIRKKNKELRLRSLANAKLGNVRSTSASLKKKAAKVLGDNSNCPYCQKTFLTKEMVLDHIYPVAEGGLDTHHNTVLVCYPCNSKKSDMTLRAFSKLMRFDYELICERLENLGKKI